MKSVEAPFSSLREQTARDEVCPAIYLLCWKPNLRIYRQPLDGMCCVASYDELHRWRGPCFSLEETADGGAEDQVAVFFETDLLQR